MPTKFNDNKIESLKQDIQDITKTLYLDNDYKSIEIRKIAKEVKISVGMFYKLYKSKEELFREIILREKKLGREKINDAIKKYINSPKQALKAYYDGVITEFYENPILSKAMTNNDLNILTGLLDYEDMKKEREQSLQYLKNLCKYWEEKKLINSGNVLAISSSIRALSMLWFHKKEIGSDYEEVIGYMFDKLLEDL